MNGSELEQYAERGEASRSDLSRGVVHQLHLSDNWLCDMEHRCEFGAGAPVNIRLSMKSHPPVVVCLTSSSDDVPYWQVNRKNAIWRRSINWLKVVVTFARCRCRAVPSASIFLKPAIA